MAIRRNNRAERRTKRISAEIPAAPGAYALILEIPRDLNVPAGSGGRLTRGHYIYCGSARGPGGIRARVARHLRADKSLHWHIDRLQPQDYAIAVIFDTGTTECALAEAFMGIDGAEMPIRGFGASDCTTCSSHLVRLPRAMSPRVITEAMGPAGGTPVLIDTAGMTSLQRSSRRANR